MLRIRSPIPGRLGGEGRQRRSQVRRMRRAVSGVMKRIHDPSPVMIAASRLLRDPQVSRGNQPQRRLARQMVLTVANVVEIA